MPDSRDTYNALDFDARDELDEEAAERAERLRELLTGLPARPGVLR